RFLPAVRGPGRVAAGGRASAREPAPAAGVRTGLLRRLLAGGRPGTGAGVPGAPHETLGGREGRPHRRGVDPVGWVNRRVWGPGPSPLPGLPQSAGPARPIFLPGGVVHGLPTATPPRRAG